MSTALEHYMTALDKVLNGPGDPTIFEIREAANAVITAYDAENPELLQAIVMVLDFSPEDEWDDVENRVTWKTGQMIVACPVAGCDGTEFYEIDRSIRWNAIDECTDVDGWFGVTQQDHEAETVAFMCQVCNTHVLWPESDETSLVYA